MLPALDGATDADLPILPHILACNWCTSCVGKASETYTVYTSDVCGTEHEV